MKALFGFRKKWRGDRRFRFGFFRESEIVSNLLDRFPRNTFLTSPVSRKQRSIADDIDQPGIPLEMSAICSTASGTNRFLYSWPARITR